MNMGYFVWAYWILFLTTRVIDGVTFPNGHETPRRPGSSQRIIGPRPPANGATSPQAVIGRQPPPFPPPPMPPPYPQWQGPYPGVGPMGSPMQPPIQWPPMQPEWNQPPPQLPPPPPMPAPQQSQYWPQPSQWPYVETAASRWGQGGPPPPQLPPPGQAPPPWQPPVPAMYSQYLPTTLGAAASAPSPPWNAPGTIIGGPQLSPRGPWSAQPMIGHSPTSKGMPAYIQSGYDASQAAQSVKNANPFSRSTQTQSRTIIAESKSPILEPAYAVDEREKWTYAQNSNSAQPSDPEMPAYPVPSDYYQPPPSNPNSNQIFALRGRDHGQDQAAKTTMPESDEFEESNLRVNPEDSLFTTQSTTPEPTDDPFALNPNIIFGGPASLTFPEIPLGLASGFAENKNTSTLSVSSIRIGDILSFPQGTQFGVVPPPSLASSKKLNLYNIRNPQMPDIFAPDQETKSVDNPVVRILQINGRTENQDGQLNAQMPIPIADPSSVVSNERMGRAYKGVKHSQNTAKSGTRTVMDDILSQIQDLKVVLYGRANCSVCVETEALLKNYSIPVYFFELDTSEKGEEMLTVVQQMTHSMESPLTFICGRFVGGHQRLRDLHANEAIPALLRECIPSKRRFAKRVDRK